MPEDCFRRPLGLVLTAGGALGAWQAAALKTLESEYGLAFDAALGFSAGALTGAAYCLGVLPEAVERWSRLDGGILRLRPRLFPFALFSNTSVWDNVHSFGSGEEEAKARARCRLVVVSARTRRDSQVYAVFSPGARDGWDGPLDAHLVASCAVPVVFPPVRVPYRGESLTIFDGGVPCDEPMTFCALSGCRDVVVVETVRPDERGRARQGILERIDQECREALLGVIAEGISSLRALPDPPRVFRLRPSRVLDFQMLDFRAVHLREALSRGVADARGFMENPLERLAAR